MKFHFGNKVFRPYSYASFCAQKLPAVSVLAKTMLSADLLMTGEDGKF
jgi:hypothetical protein